jgi:hypothetical protein
VKELPSLQIKLAMNLPCDLQKGNHTFIVVTHVDKAYMHNHIIYDSKSLDCTKKSRDFSGSGKVVRRVSDITCLENGLSIIENPKKSSKQYDKWLGNKNPVTHSERIREMIEEVLKSRQKDFEEFLGRIELHGYEVKRGKYVAIKDPEQKKFILLRSLGEGFSEDEIRERKYL